MFGVADITLEMLERDPYPIFSKLRDQEPVAFLPRLDMWLVTRWDDVVDVCEHPELFRSNTVPSWLRDCLGENMLTLDGAAHDRLANGMRPPFVSSTALPIVRDGLPALYDALIDQFPAGEEVELMAAYAEPLANLSLAAALGWTVDWHDLARWCRGVCTGIANFENDPDRAEVAAVAHRELADAIDAALARGELAIYLRHGFTRDEIVNNIRLMVSGGINEPRDGVALVMWVLLTEPAAMAAVRADRSVLRKVIEETFRWISPVGTATRQATSDVILGDVQIPEGALVAACLSAANRDPRRWQDPDTFLIDRREGSHLAFAIGEHRCLGEWLGRRQVQLGVERLLDRFVDFELTRPVELTGFEFRGPAALYVKAVGR
ncbi:MAG: cytochrome P450 [Actinobacteria bacterium]|nr:cytochrome P450 [Actinomycetota bacterium]